MSSFLRTTKHPKTKKWHTAAWIDDYFGHYKYAVIFPGMEVFNADDREWETKDKKIDELTWEDFKDYPNYEPLVLPENFGKFVTKDSGKRKEFASGMVRDLNDDKPMYTLCYQPMFKRWAELMTRGAKKYGANNWKKAEGEEELERFKDSALRHMMQWLEGDKTEDHAAAVFFNISGCEYVKSKLKYGKP